MAQPETLLLCRCAAAAAAPRPQGALRVQPWMKEAADVGATRLMWVGLAAGGTPPAASWVVVTDYQGMDLLAA